MFQEEPPAGEGQGSARAAIDRLCQDLNMDAASATDALSDFTALRGTYSLEGEVVHWLACALYVACRKSILPTVGSGLMEGNCVSLTRILRSAKLSLIQFFSKMKKWMDMSDPPQEFRERMGRLERNFEVSTVIFRKFEPIFLDVFQNPYEEIPKPQRSRKQRVNPLPLSLKVQSFKKFNEQKIVAGGIDLDKEKSGELKQLSGRSFFSMQKIKNM